MLAADTADFSRRIWRTQDGLPQSRVQALAQTPDGYLWVGTSGGLVRFDGLRFVVFDRSNAPELRDDSIVSLLAAKDRSLWIGTEGGGLVHLRGAAFDVFGRGSGLTNLFVKSIYEDREGTLWAGTDRGFFRFDHGRFVRLDGGNVPLAAVAAMAEDGNGTLWLGGALGLRFVRGGKLYSTPFKSPVRSIVNARDGTVWFATAEGLQTLKPGTDGVLLPYRNGGNGVDPRQLLQDNKGTLWIGTVGQGLLRSTGGAVKTMRLPNDSVLSLLQDRQQNLWVGTEDGLLRLTRSLTRSLTTDDGLEDDSVSTVYRDRQNRLWITTVTGKLYQVNGGKAVPFHLPGEKGPIQSLNIYEDAQNALWIGTRDRGIARSDGGTTTFYTTAAGLKNDHARAFAEDRNGDLWAATGSGLARWDGRRFQIYYLEDGLSYGSVRTVLALREPPYQGDILVGTDGGLNRVHERKIVRDPLLVQFAGEKIWSTFEDVAGGIWIGTTGNGLFRIKNGKVAQFRTGDGLLSNFIYQIVDDSKGRLWFSTPGGIFAAKRSDLDSIAEGKPGPAPTVPFGTAEGLQSTQMNGGTQSAGCRTATGELWFPSAKGVVRIDPERLPVSTSAPVLIESLTADESPLGSTKKIPAGTRKLEIDFTACDLSSPERLRFKYKLDGFDDKWTTASSRRAAYYTNLPPRDYRFRVISMDGSEASVAFHWQPFFYQTKWFYGLCVLAAGLLAWLGLRLFARQTKARYALLLAERSRLAREMHDTLIQGCVGVSTLLEAAGTLENTGTERQLVEKAREQVRATIEEARQAVWDLRHDSAEGGFAVKLAGWARTMGSERGIEVESRVVGRPVSLPADADRNLLLVGREAVRNATAHGHASRVSIEVNFEKDVLRISITDNGCGFDPNLVHGPEKGHYGMLGMRERVEMMGGSLKIESAPGKAHPSAFRYR